MMLPLGMSPDGARVAEIGAFCVDVVFRGTGRGDSLLDYVEQVRPVNQHDNLQSHVSSIPVVCLGVSSIL